MLRLLLSFACGSAVAVGLPSNHFKLADTHLRGRESFLRNQRALELGQENEQASIMHHIRRLYAPTLAAVELSQEKRAMEQNAQLRHAIRQREAADRALKPAYAESRAAWKGIDHPHKVRQDAIRKERTAKAAYDDARTKDMYRSISKDRRRRRTPHDEKKPDEKAEMMLLIASADVQAAEERYAAANLRYREAEANRMFANVRVRLAEDEEEIARIMAQGGVPDRSDYYNEAEYLDWYDEHVQAGNYGKYGFLDLERKQATSRKPPATPNKPRRNSSSSSFSFPENYFSVSD